jgi:hypothetical protein
MRCDKSANLAQHDGRRENRANDHVAFVADHLCYDGVLMARSLNPGILEIRVIAPMIMPLR